MTTDKLFSDSRFPPALSACTGAGFSALGGSSPKAAHIAANVNFVMMADVDDGGSNVYTDMVWWSGIRNPATWTPSQATQAGNIRLLDIPGVRDGIVDFAHKLTATPAEAGAADRRRLARAGFSARDIWDIAAVTGFFNMTNRLATATDMMPNLEYHARSR